MHVWSADEFGGTVQLQVFNDSDAEGQHNDARPPLDWRTSVAYSEDPLPHTWHWPERA